MSAELLTTEDKDRIKAEILANCELVADCWLYKGAINKSGYGMKKIGKRVYTVSRFMLAYATRESLSNPKYDACHRDDVCPYKSCCNPRHLYWATKSANCMAREKRAREERELFSFWETTAWINGVFYTDRRDPSIEHCLASLNRGKVVHATTVMLEDENTANPFTFLADIYRETLARWQGTVNHI